MIERVSLGFARTVCGCEACKDCCRHMSGMLIPDDLPSLPWDGLVAWAEQNLMASPGALVAKDGRAFRIHTLVPARKADGRCIHLTAENQCAIHATAGFGCAFFDRHMDDVEGTRRSATALVEIHKDFVAGGTYSRLWHHLWIAGLRALPPEEARRRYS